MAKQQICNYQPTVRCKRKQHCHECPYRVGRIKFNGIRYRKEKE